MHHPILITRITKALLSTVSLLLPPAQSIVQSETVTPSAGGSKKGKKRARGYEGDEILKQTMNVMCATEAEGEMVLEALAGARVHGIARRATASSTS